MNAALSATLVFLLRIAMAGLACWDRINGQEPEAEDLTP